MARLLKKRPRQAKPGKTPPEKARNRLFFALTPDPAALAEAAAVQALFPRPMSEYWTKPTDLRLAFAVPFGVEYKWLDAMRRVAEAVGGEEFELSLDCLSYWPNMLVLCLTPSAVPAPLQRLIEELEAGVGRAGIEVPPKRPYPPHLVLARESAFPPAEIALERPVSWRVKSFELIEAVPAGKSDSYHVVASWPLSKAARRQAPAPGRRKPGGGWRERLGFRIPGLAGPARPGFGVMVSDSFAALDEQRGALLKAMATQGLKAVAAPEDAPPRTEAEALACALERVRAAAAYVGVISHKYGQIPKCPERNPLRLSLAELELNEAHDNGKPALLLIMGEDHAVRPSEVERDPEKIEKLEIFRKNARQPPPEGGAPRLYRFFNDLPEFEAAAAQGLADLVRYLEAKATGPAAPAASPEAAPALPAPPAFHAERPCGEGRALAGRRAQLETLDDWAAAACAHPVLLLEAGAGAGKTLLAWHWATGRAPEVRADWAGRLWYSFDGNNAGMADFCRLALAYMTGRPAGAFAGQKAAALGGQLLAELQARPWLVVLDRLDRVLAGSGRDPCAAARREDGELLRRLAGAAPSRLLATSRAAPRVWQEPCGRPVPGVLRERLPGLRPADAEALWRSLGGGGEGGAVRAYLQAHCDGHPQAVAALARLVLQHTAAAGDLGAWAGDPQGGGRLKLEGLDLEKKRRRLLDLAAALP